MAKSRHLRFRLTARRVRLHGILLALCLWSVYAADLATPGLRDRNGLIKGTDFLHFYTLGSLALHGQANLLYDIWGQAKLIAEALPQLAGTVYVPLYGPQVSLLFAPFAELPYLWAYAVWASLNCLIYLLCVHAVWKTCPSLREHRWTVLILALAFPGFFHLIIWGQTSGIALACFTLAYMALRARHPFLAGLAIGSLVIKPQLASRVRGSVFFVWRMAGGCRGRARCRSSTFDRLGLLREPGDAGLLPRPSARRADDPSARTTSLPDAFAARILVAPGALEFSCAGTLCRERNCGACDRDPMLEKCCAAECPLFCITAGQRAGIPSPHGVRPGDTRACIPTADRRGYQARRYRLVCGTAAHLCLLWFFLDWSAGQLHTATAVGNRHVRTALDMLSCEPAHHGPFIRQPVIESSAARSAASADQAAETCLLPFSPGADSSRMIP